MRFALAYLREQQALLPPERFGRPDRWSAVLLTPTYATSAHVVFLVYGDAGGPPVLVLKATRVPGAGVYLRREAANLRAVQAARAGGFDSVPEVVATGAFHGSDVLLQTGLAGTPVGRSLVLRRFDECRDALLDWVLQLHGATRGGGTDDGFERHAAGALTAAGSLFPGEQALLHRTREILDELRGVRVGTVFEHGDLSAPNLLLTDRGGLQVVDWELARADGLPGADLFFGLTYLAFARARAHDNAARTAAARDAFFGATAWAAAPIERYRSQLGLATGTVRPLFVLCWLRYLAGLAQRLSFDGDPAAANRAAAWLQRNHYYDVWRESVQCYDTLLPSLAAPA